MNFVFEILKEELCCKCRKQMLCSIWVYEKKNDGLREAKIVFDEFCI